MDRKILIGVSGSFVALLLIVSLWSLTGDPECTRHDDCPAQLSCINETCVDPCHGACGHKTLCHVVRHLPRCSCVPGFIGNPLAGCVAMPKPQCTSSEQCPQHLACSNQKCVDPCRYSCGTNADCEVKNHVPACACKPEFTGNPLSYCAAKIIPECTSNDQCSPELACSNQKCVDPCKNACGINADCEVKDHLPVCACKPGFTGHPISYCAPQNLGKVQKKYQLHKSPVSWVDALEECRNRSMRLVTIDTQEEQEALVAYIKQNETDATNWWTSGVDIGTSRQYVWVSTGSPLTYTDWNKGEPSRHSFINIHYRRETEACLELAGEWEYKWNDVSCTRMNFYICEYF